MANTTLKRRLVVSLLLVWLLPLVGACQAKEEKLKVELEHCNRDSSPLCYMALIIEHPEYEQIISENGQKVITKKCSAYDGESRWAEATFCWQGLLMLESSSYFYHQKIARSYVRWYEARNANNDDLLDTAEQHIRESIELNPDRAESYFIYAEILSNKKNAQAALKEINKAIDHAPNEVLFHIRKGMLQSETGDIKGAIVSYNEGLKLSPQQTLIFYELGVLYEKNGETEKAIEHYEKLLNIKKPYDDVESRLESLKKLKPNN